MFIVLSSLFSCVCLAVVIAMAYSKYIATQQYALLGLMAVSAERSFPLTAAIEAFAREGGWFAWRAHRLAGMLTDGVPLPAALAEVPGVLPREALPLVRAGYQTGALAQALRQAAANRNLHEPVWQSLLPKFGYVCFLPWFGVCVVTFLMLKIVPEFEKIFKDFGTSLPAMTQTLVAAGRWFAPFGFLLFWVFVASTLLLVYLVLRYVGAIHWDLPGTGWIVRRLDTAALLDALSLGVAYRLPMAQAIADLTACYPKAPIRRRLGAVLADVQGGSDWCDSLHRRGLIGRVDFAVLQAAARVGNLPWAMREMADSNRRRFTYRAHAVVQLAFPPIIIAFGLMVMFVVIALFLPLVNLISNLSR